MVSVVVSVVVVVTTVSTAGGASSTGAATVVVSVVVVSAVSLLLQAKVTPTIINAKKVLLIKFVFILFKFKSELMVYDKEERKRKNRTITKNAQN